MNASCDILPSRTRPHELAVLGLAACVSLFVLAVAWRRREGIGGRPFIAMVVAIVVWTLCAALEAAAREPAAKLLFAKAGYIGAVAVAPSRLFQ